MKTKVITFSERNIKAEQSGSARTLRDPAFPLRFRFHQSRQTGSWYVVKKDKWTKLGDWPCVTWDSIQKNLPEILIRVEAPADVSLAVDGFTHCGQVFDWFIEQQKNKVGNKRLSSLKSAFAKHITPEFGDLHISLLNESEIKKFIKNKVNYSQNTIRQWVGYINQAMSDGFISGVFAIGLSRPTRFNRNYCNEQDSSSVGYVYAMTNPALIGLYKVGMTELTVEKRRQSLSACTSIPFDFEVYRCIAVNKSQLRKVERIAHDLLSNNRVSNNKEFFKADSELIIDDVFDGLEKRFGIKC
ncbi:GIY-YIG nuclease family protein [Vibrio parahaemolyticus]|uniref:GIY-YIG nuclease family protein n=1 Tax=Vibrio parahaemolyticus TaxID=670 RepID=UPI001D1667EC|nr:GIY-YIG nuclease family protein [Vibrio parahaemolyticus]MCC3798239.1 GIY-YIG nuclease family protein [Vibrio parahaemolyticus]